MVYIMYTPFFYSMKLKQMGAKWTMNGIYKQFKNPLPINKIIFRNFSIIIISSIKHLFTLPACVCVCI
jgi:hypothetical protein